MNILTFDIEEWFHLLDFDSTRTEEQWLTYESRIHGNMERIFSMLDKHNVKATFFVIGWIAKNYPEVVKRIADSGYEVACHTESHCLLSEQTPSSFKEDTRSAIERLEDLTGRKVETFRAPGFSLTEKQNWAFEILSDLGIKYDSSIFPAIHSHGGYPSFPTVSPALIEVGGMQIKEFPISIVKVAGINTIFSGGGYFRLFPYALIKHWAESSPYIMAYFHPRDFDSEQPMLKNLPLKRQFRSYIGLKKAADKLDHFLSDFQFVDIRQADGQIEWDSVPLVKI